MLQPQPSHASPPASGYAFDNCSPFASIDLVQLAGDDSLRDRLLRCLQRRSALRKAR
ncbi:hypothetical protein [Pseudomonas sp. BN417]|uniref:hypothetical protein n=1 Tax=Pseudomonas sp. BN417 TaxID=2567890 RepID=UPI002455826E|nr:hypothetical protein [Pseudomonas sp. BN417]